MELTPCKFFLTNKESTHLSKANKERMSLLEIDIELNAIVLIQLY